MAENTSSSGSSPQEIKNTISKHLRAADEFFRYSKFEEALTQIEFVLMIDPKNTLARSFKERVIMMQKRMNAPNVQSKPAEMTEEQRRTAIAKLLASADEMIRSGDFKRALNMIAEVYKIEPQNFYAKAYSDRIEQLQQQQQTNAAAFFGKSPQASAQGQATPQVHGAFYMYRELMKEVWFDGKVTPAEEQELKRVRDLFTITNKEHFEIEHEVKIEAYLEALRLAWRDGVLTQNERQVLELMRQKYGITTDEHLAAESKVQEAKKGTPTKATILIVDTDKDHRTGISELLKQRNYDVISAGTVEEAFQRIVKQFPHLVLSEIMFTSAHEDGFGLFKKLKEHPTLNNVPFFFMSKLHDENVVRAAYRLGGNLYFPKPVDQELFLAAIEGRLKK